MNRAAQSLGRLGGKAGTGKSKARTSAQARKAVKARWEKWRVAKKLAAASAYAKEWRKGNS
jgi:hypothetical protein